MTHALRLASLATFAAAFLAPATLVHAQPASPDTPVPPYEQSQSAPVLAVRPVDPARWRVTLVPYLWMAGVKSGVSFSPPPGATRTIDANVDVSFLDLLQRLHIAFMGAGEARLGRFSAQTDLMYMSLSQGGSRVERVTGPRGRFEIPVNLGGDLDLKTTIWTLTGGYDVFRDNQSFVQLFAGFRYLHGDANLDWRFQGPLALLPRTGAVDGSVDIWDGIVGVRGERALGDGPWKLVYYGDVGAGASKVTWQASAEIAYARRWGDVGIGWRYLDYQEHGSELIKNLSLSGPIIVAHFPFGG